MHLTTKLNKQLGEVACGNRNKTKLKLKTQELSRLAHVRWITVNQAPLLSVRMSHKADPVTCKAYSEVTMMWVALRINPWQRARAESGGHPLNLPLVGSGLSGLGLPTRDLLNLIILSAITETKAKQVTPTIRIVLHRDRFEELDLREVKAHWEAFDYGPTVMRTYDGILTPTAPIFRPTRTSNITI